MSIVNSEGEVPSDLAEEPAMKDLLLEQVKKQGNQAQTRHPGAVVVTGRALCVSALVFGRTSSDRVPPHLTGASQFAGWHWLCGRDSRCLSTSR